MFSVTIVVLLGLLVLPGIKMKSVASGIQKQETVALKGLMCLIVMLHHFSGWFAATDIILYFFQHCGSFMVSVFFFLSAYGLSKSRSCDKQNIKELFVRILKIFIPFWLIEIIYLFFYYSLDLQMNIDVSITNILLSVINLSEIVSFSWFVSTIIFLYILYFLIDKIKSSIRIWIFFIILFAISFFVPELWLTFFAFPLGLLISENEKKLLALSKGKFVASVAFALVLILPAIMLKYYSEISSYKSILAGVSDIISGCMFTLVIYLLATRIHFGNKVLMLIGSFSYEIYLLHGLGIFVGGKFFGSTHPYMFLLITLVFTLAIAFVVNRVCKKIFKLLPIVKK